MDQRHATAECKADDGHESEVDRLLPIITASERDFWRRAVAAERQRQLQRRGRPAQFPFQPA